MGQDLVSFRNGFWRGRTTQTASDRGDRRLRKIVNGYVSADGHEIRQFPGWKTLIDLTEANNDLGYARYTFDGVRPVVGTSGASDQWVYAYRGEDARLQTQRARAKPTHLHGFEQIRDRIVVFGESRFREFPIMDTNRVIGTVAGVAIDAPGLEFRVQFSINPAAYEDSDTQAGMNGLRVGDTVYFEGITVPTDAALQAQVDAHLNGRVTVVLSIAGDDVIVRTQGTAAFSKTAATGSGHRVMPNRDDTYPTPGGPTPYDANGYARPDDPDALTAWTVIDELTDFTAVVPCYPAWVANRMPDFGDIPTTPAMAAHGGFELASGRFVSRRDQRKLPYRLNPEPAGDRIILAAPGYNCLFHIPVKVPFNPDNWPATPSINAGVPWVNNDIFDRPRALGLPKPRLIESAWTPVMSSPSMRGDWNFNAVLVSSAVPNIGLPAGIYKIRASFLDESTSEEGPASEEIEVEIPATAGTYSFTLCVPYLHPGYVMPECMATRINIYIAPPGIDAYGFYGSYPLSETLSGALTAPNPLENQSGKYGFTGSALYRKLILPLPNRIGITSIEDDLDFTRPAPRSAFPPRGAEAAAFVKGTLVTVGHRGNSGASGDLYESQASVFHDPTPNSFELSRRVIRVRQWDGGTPIVNTSTEGNVDGKFGLASRTFPDAYAGIRAISTSLFPGPLYDAVVARTLNRRSRGLGDFELVDNVLAEQTDWMIERIETTRPIVNYQRPGYDTTLNSTYERSGQPVYYEMFKGQVQVGDPGAPWRASKAAIQFMDPSRDDDAVAIRQLAGTVVICTRRETYTMAWVRDPGGEIPQPLSRQYGCIAANSMVEFDGGLAWISEYGPVALGQGLQFVGEDVRDDFTGWTRRYLTDTKGMMRHCWGVHDPERGLVMWGMVTDANTTTVIDEGVSYTFETASDELRSRWPCDEVLVWSYRAGAFSTWRPPAGMEVLWMRSIRLAGVNNGRTRLAFLAADQRIYGLDDSWADTNFAPLEGNPSANQTTASTQLSIGAFNVDGTAGGAAARSVGANLIKAGMRVEQVNADDELIAETTVESYDEATSTITLADALTWRRTDTFRVGVRPPMTVQTTYIGNETMTNLSVQGVQMRYSLFGAGKAYAKVVGYKTDAAAMATPLSVAFTTPGKWQYLGNAGATFFGSERDEIPSRRMQFLRGQADAPEVAVEITVTGQSQVRIADLMLEVG